MQCDPISREKPPPPSHVRVKMDFLFLFSHSKVCESIIAFMGGLVVRKKRLKSSLGGIGSYAMDKETREIDENFLKENLLR